MWYTARNTEKQIHTKIVVFIGMHFFLGLLLCIYLFLLLKYRDISTYCELLEGNCLAVIQSQYGYFFGFPVSTIGMGYFATQLALVIPLLKAAEIHPFRMYFNISFLLSFAALAVSLLYGYVLLHTLKLSCPGCFGVHAVNFIVFCSFCVALSASKKEPVSENSDSPELRKIARRNIAIAMLTGLALFLALNLIKTRQDFTVERQKISNNLNYYKYLHRSQPLHTFTIQPEDEIYGEKGIALHEIVLIYKEECFSCQQARRKLLQLGRDYGMQVYIVMKNYKTLSGERLKELKVDKVPAVFVNGRYAEGWEVDGFLKEYAEDCGC